MNTPVDKLFVKLHVDEQVGLSLRSIGRKDMEDLRQWKNAHRDFFFYKEIVDEAHQHLWFSDYLRRSHDFMFLVEIGGVGIGCMGVRWLDSHWDIYNVILGRSEFGHQGFMGKALKVMLLYARSLKDEPISLRVLKRNPAIQWYLKNYFIIEDEHPEHLKLNYSEPGE